MTAFPVLWWNRNPDAVDVGYWDQGLLVGLLNREVWAVPGGFEFVQHDRRADGLWYSRRSGLAYSLRDLHAAVVVVPARHNVDHVDTLIDDLNTLDDGAVLVLTGDEEGAFPWERVAALDHVRLWVMTPQPGVDYGDAMLIGSGWPPGIRDVLRTVPAEESRSPWAFMGQVTHARRQDCVAMLHERADRDASWLVETPGFTQGEPQADYWLDLAHAKVAPAPSGPISPDSFRLYEALEAGCIPIADDVTPDGLVHGFWQRLFGACPFPIVSEGWARESETIDWLLDGWPANANRVFAWWQRRKRLLAYRLHNDIAALSTAERDTTDPATAVSALIITSPCPKHPSIDDLRITVESVQRQLPGVEIVLVFDGVPPELEHRRAAYEEYTRRALWAANTQWPNVAPIVLDDWHHQARAARIGLDEIATRHVLFVEHDTPVVGEIDWPGLVATLDTGTVDLIRLHHETAIGEHHAHMMLDDHPRHVFGPAPIVRTYQWSQRPHVARVSWYRDRILDRHFHEKARAMIEDVMHGIVATAWNEYGIAGWERFKLGIYHPDDPNIQRSTHLDSRRLVLGEEASGDAKPKQRFVYPGDTPEGAPGPGWR